MMVRHVHELPEDRERLLRKAVRLEWLTIAYLLSAIGALYLTLGNSQALKAAWFEDSLSLAPPIAFLIAVRVRNRQPDDEFPYGYHRAVNIAFLCASLTLLTLGAYILYDSVAKLIAFEHPPIGTVTLLGRQIWLGWLMLAALAWSAIPAVLLGRAKIPLAEALHEKVLYADAKMNKADWLTATAAGLGIIGVALGLWWADAVAATLISLDITYDGWSNLRNAVANLMDSRPRTYDGKPDDLVDRVEAELRGMDWVRDVRVRLREEGHVFTGEALVVPELDDHLPGRIDHAVERVLALDWRLHEIIISPVLKL
jgi:cation diffusion facilitator family transporter